jgi:enamine deaminase RidA (YjgF/YER057c/UK114 family)
LKISLEQTFKNLDQCLKAAGATWADVVKTNTFVTDFDEFQKCGDVRMRYLGVATPTSTTVGVTRAPTVTTPTISGTVQEGQTLTASASAGQSDNPVTYAWYSAADGYTGVIGTGSTYLVKEGDESFTIEVKATATNDNGVTISATSTYDMTRARARIPVMSQFECNSDSRPRRNRRNA